MTARFTFVHGLNTPADYPYEAAWGPPIRRHYPGARLDLARWPSTGTITGDCFKIGLQPGYRERCREAVLHTFTGFEDLIIAHSMGTVWLVSILDELYEDVFQRVLPQVFLVGSPLSHPVLRSLPGVRGQLRRARKKRLAHVQHFFNRDDRVCALSGRASNPDWVTAKPVAIPGRARTEHPLELYLESFVMQRALKELTF